MKKSSIIALVACAVLFVACNNQSKNSENTEENVQAVEAVDSTAAAVPDSAAVTTAPADSVKTAE